MRFWDHTLQMGNDIEYSLVILALIAGVGFGIVHLAAFVMRAVSKPFPCTAEGGSASQPPACHSESILF